MKINGIPVGTTMPRSDWGQKDPTKADYIRNKPDFSNIYAEIDNKIRPIDGNFDVEFEQGDMEVLADGSLNYKQNNGRRRTKEGVTYEVPKGSSFWLSDYSSGSMLVVYYSYDDGATYTGITLYSGLPIFTVTDKARVALKITSTRTDLFMANIPSHITDTSNPHKVTAEQVGSIFDVEYELGFINSSMEYTDIDYQDAAHNRYVRTKKGKLYKVPAGTTFMLREYTQWSTLIVRYSENGVNTFTALVANQSIPSVKIPCDAYVALTFGTGSEQTENTVATLADLLLVCTPSAIGKVFWGFGKNLVNIGDSIFGLHDWESISYYLTQFSGANVYNCAFGGTCVIENTGTDYTIPFHFENLAKAICGEVTVNGSTDPWASQKSAVSGMAETTDGQKYTKERYQNHLNNIMGVDFAYVDVLTIAYGTNDWARGYYGGTPPTLAEVVTTLENGIKKINKKYPKLKIVLICPIWRWWDSKDSDITDYGTGTLEDFSVEYDKLAKKLKVPYLDVYHNLTFNNDNRTVFYEETAESSTHLNPDGREMYAELLNGKLKTLF